MKILEMNRQEDLHHNRGTPELLMIGSVKGGRYRIKQECLAALCRATSVLLH